MEKIKLKIEGMSCGHCVMTVQNALEKVDGVSSVKVNIKKKSAEVKAAENVSKSVLVKAVTDTGYGAEAV